MNELTIIALVAGSFAATNMDNLTILVSWMLAGKIPAASIAGGYAIATVVDDGLELRFHVCKLLSK